MSSQALRELSVAENTGSFEWNLWSNNVKLEPHCSWFLKSTVSVNQAPSRNPWSRTTARNTVLLVLHWRHRSLRNPVQSVHKWLANAHASVPNASGQSQVQVHEIFRVVLAVDTTDGRLTEFLRVSKPLVWSKFACQNVFLTLFHEPPGLLMDVASWMSTRDHRENKPVPESGDRGSPRLLVSLKEVLVEIKMAS